MKERMKAKVDAKNTKPAAQNPVKPESQAISEEELIKIFSTGEKVEKTPRGSKPPVQQQQPILKQEGKQKPKKKK